MSAPTPAAALASPIFDYGSWNLSVHCEGCRQLSRINIDRIYAKHPDLRLIDLVARLRCDRCKGRPSSVRMRDGEKYAGRTDVTEVLLLGE